MGEILNSPLSRLRSLVDEVVLVIDRQVGGDEDRNGESSTELTRLMTSLV